MQGQRPGRILPCRRTQPGPRRKGIEHGLLGAEGLARHHKQRRARVQGIQQLGQMGAIHVGHKVQAQPRPLIGRQRAHHRLGPQVRTANPDVHHIANRLARKAPPQTAPHPLGKRPHLRPHRTHLGHHIPLGRRKRPQLEMPQRRVHHRPLLAEIDLVPREQTIPPFPQLRRLRQVDQQTQRGGIDALLGKIHQQTFEHHRKARKTLRVGRKQIAQMRLGKLIAVSEQCLPGGGVNIGHKAKAPSVANRCQANGHHPGIGRRRMQRSGLMRTR